jgi:hypothetical protein
MSNIQHVPNCSCGNHDANIEKEIKDEHSESRRDFLKITVTPGAGLLSSPLLALVTGGDEKHHQQILNSKAEKH